MSNVILFKRPESNAIDVSSLATRPMPDVYDIVMGADLGSSGSKAVLTMLRFVARTLIGMVTGDSRKPAAALRLTNEAALRRACDLLDMATEIEKRAEAPATDGGL